MSHAWKMIVLVMLAAAIVASPPPSGLIGLGGPAFADDDDDDDDNDDRPRRLRRYLPLPRIEFELRRRGPSRAPSAREQRSTELLAIGLSADQITTLQAQGFAVRGQSNSTLLGSTIVRFSSTSRERLQRALQRARRIAPGALITTNDLFVRPRSDLFRPAGEACGQSCPSFRLTAWTLPNSTCRFPDIGVIDTAADVAHPSFAQATIVQHVARSADRRPAAGSHGTGILSLLVGTSASGVAGLVPGARILAVDAFHDAGTSIATDAYDIVAALDWLLSQNVGLINLSLTGPDNPVLERAVEAAMGRGAVLVAAAGRPDARNALGFPGRYPGVLSVAAVDERMRASRLSARGRHIFAVAPGVGITVAGEKGTLQSVSGTSFAAPFLTAAFAHGLAAGRPAAEIRSLLATTAKDLGSPGRDDLYGWGLVQFSGMPRC